MNIEIKLESQEQLQAALQKIESTNDLMYHLKIYLVETPKDSTVSRFVYAKYKFNESSKYYIIVQYDLAAKWVDIDKMKEDVDLIEFVVKMF